MKNSKNSNVIINCSYIPIEVISAAGYMPKRIWPNKIGKNGREFLPVNFCPYSRSFLSETINRKEKVVVANSCDAMRRVYDVYEKNNFLFQIPRKTSERYVEFYKNKIQDLIGFLGKDLKNLSEKINEYEQGRNLLKKLRNLLVNSTNYSFTYLIKGIKYYYKSENKKIEKLINEIEYKNSNKIDNENTDAKPRIIVSSSNLLDSSLVNLIEDINMNIVGLDSCMGERSFDFEINENDSNKTSLTKLAKGYMKKPACPRMMELDKRLTELKELISERKAEGLIYFIPKFCDQGSYDFKYLKEWSIENNFPVLLLEGEYKSGKSGQFTTRIEAFKESLAYSRIEV